ncbi:KTSC domain-containing protein [Empedobacter falsenii]
MQGDIHNAVYHYYDVPYNVYNNLMNASSHGKYLISNIQDNYKYKRI